MNSTPVIAIIDVGKTNKKLFLFDEDYKIVYERSARFTDIPDEDGDPCENLEALRLFVFDALREVLLKKEFDVKAVNFSTYGASFVLIDEDGRPVAPLYNYLKPYPEELKQVFYDTYGGEEEFSYTTASPVLGSLNSGMQLYRLKNEKPALFGQVKYALHLPQYLSFLISGIAFSDITSIGCHTNLWDFPRNDYHAWVYREGVSEKLAPIAPSEKPVPAVFPANVGSVGIGLHDSSAALIPYLVSFTEPFVLISTGTWCITLNPFNQAPLTAEELDLDCLSYMHYQGKPIKASRLFAGNEHEQQTARLAAHFGVDPVYFRTVPFDSDLIARLKAKEEIASGISTKELIKESLFARRDLASFASVDEAYHQLILDIIAQQYASTQLVVSGTPVKRIFVDGGFGKNAVYMNLLAAAFPELEVYAASMAQATSVGTALAIHTAWNSKPLPSDLIELKKYSVTQEVVL
ncbi:FGGY family carbohydrate kinase [Paraflavisolibacter sp. H34]|uniref:FGGY-family carbohydrate kinase n=1 Tax=Huijunlia imazamoxiresistens TaxID=3127457 RepID=UPI0030176E60